MKRFFSAWLISLIAIVAQAQIINPVKWSASVKMESDDKGSIVIEASVEDGWHFYGMNLPSGGPVSTTFTITPPPGITLQGEIKPNVAPEKEMDKQFNMMVTFWDGDVKFTQPFKVTDPSTAGGPISVKVRYQGCDDQRCIAPQTQAFELKAPVTVKPAANKTEESKKDKVVPEDNAKSKEEKAPELKSAEIAETEASTENNPATDTIVESNPDSLPAVQQIENPSSEEAWWTPAVFPGQEDTRPVSETPWWYIFIWGFAGGLLALLTPCVWPLIPMTVSFFLKKTGCRRKAIGDAMIYGASIVVLYLVLGLAITLIFGASKLNDLATNAVFNLIFFLLLVIFAISFFGAFNITLPSKWSNSVDGKAEKTTGIVSIFFMAFTLALVSFSCTGPIIGTLLVEAASLGDISGPAVGMTGFALALAIPFTLFAIFPSLLKDMPKSGGWLNTVKVVLGFLELALSLKFLSVADLAYGWGLLDREIFLAIWIALFVLLGMYLLGKIRFPHDDERKSTSVFGFFLALASFSFAIYLVPGLWGAPLKGVSAFVPPLYTQDFNLYEGGQFEEFDDYDEGMRYAAETRRPVLVDFSGYGCVNCRKMEGAVFDTPEVERILKENFVMIKLMVDDKASLPEPMTVEENGRTTVLETVGDKWSYLQRSKFRANSQPYYVILDNRGQPLEAPYYYDESVTQFVEWLGRGITNFENL